MKKTEGRETILYINQYYEKNLTTGVVTTSYYLGGQLVANRVGTTLTYIHQDSLGSTSVMSTSTGTLDSSIAYFPFGSTRTGSVSTDKKFTGQRLDGTGLYYYNARYYDPLIGRFISADTAAPALMNPQSFNKYSYCFNNPLNRNDPTGQWPNWANIANNIVNTAKTVGQAIVSGAKAVVDVSKQVEETLKQYEIAAGTAVGKGIVTTAVAVTGAAVKVAQFYGESPLNQVGDTVAEWALNHTITPLLSNAGVNNIEINSTFGYVETDLSNGSWGAGLLDKIPTAGITLPTPFGSAVFLKDNAGPTFPAAQAHEETHVIQQDALGPWFVPLYYLGQWAYGGYDYNPFELQAKQNADPLLWGY